LFVPKLDDSLIGCKQLALVGWSSEVDNVLDGKAHALVLLENGPGISHVENADLSGAGAKRKRKAVVAVVQGADLSLLVTQNSNPVLAAGVEELDCSDRCAKGTQSVCRFCDRCDVDSANVHSSLQTLGCILLADINLPWAKELTSFQIEAENLAHTRSIRAHTD